MNSFPLQVEASVIHKGNLVFVVSSHLVSKFYQSLVAAYNLLGLFLAPVELTSLVLVLPTLVYDLLN